MEWLCKIGNLSISGLGRSRNDIYHLANSISTERKYAGNARHIMSLKARLFQKFNVLSTTTTYGSHQSFFRRNRETRSLIGDGQTRFPVILHELSPTRLINYQLWQDWPRVSDRRPRPDIVQVYGLMIYHGAYSGTPQTKVPDQLAASADMVVGLH